MGTELKSDASHRGMMYSRDAYEGGRIFLTAEQKQAVEEGKNSRNAHTPMSGLVMPHLCGASARFSERIFTGTSGS
ncbi:hypothetical protein PQQ73_31785 [Paraburkholderia strydomiana]|uniref:Uncharacterized protein n=1 Tax=Paraburkholderia strydomiana TaxID=1245417 RepID=A0ABW9EPB6_9BURK